MCDEAKRYLGSFPWCGEILESYFGLGIGGIVAVFLFRYVPTQEGADPWVWVVVGDLPSAYIATDRAPNAACALDAYVGAMTEWIRAVHKGACVDNLIPVNVTPNIENASRLESRLCFLDREVLAFYKTDLSVGSQRAVHGRP
jgi:hypothetical protein